VSRLKALTLRLQNLYEVSGDSSRLIPMEGMRGLAVLLVFFVHLHASFGDYLNSYPLLFDTSAAFGNIGNIGVDLFFVLSGYLIYGILLRRKTPYIKFVRRRVERIYPTFLAVFCIYLLLSFAFPFKSKIHGSFLEETVYVIQNFLLLPGIFRIQPIITVAWSLSYEFFFYLSIPVLIQLTRMRLWKRSARLTFFFFIWAGYLIYAFSVPLSQVRLLMFISGIFLFEVIDSGQVSGKLTRRGEFAAVSTFLGTLGFVFVYDMHPAWLSFLPNLRAGRSVLPGVPSIQGPYKVMFLCISCLLLCLYSFKFAGFLKRFFSWSPLRYLGNMSYSYYLMHGLTLQGVLFITSWILPSREHNPWMYALIVPLAFTATWITSTLLFALVEKPISLERRVVAKIKPIANVATN
jgi:exopolysaccharide production protein ExoZ